MVLVKQDQEVIVVHQKVVLPPAQVHHWPVRDMAIALVRQLFSVYVLPVTLVVIVVKEHVPRRTLGSIHLTV